MSNPEYVGGKAYLISGGDNTLNRHTDVERIQMRELNAQDYSASFGCSAKCVVVPVKAPRDEYRLHS